MTNTQPPTQEVRAKLVEIMIGPSCDATGGDHEEVLDGRYKYCNRCGETISGRPTISRAEANRKADQIAALFSPPAGVVEALSCIEVKGGHVTVNLGPDGFYTWSPGDDSIAANIMRMFARQALSALEGMGKQELEGIPEASSTAASWSISSQFAQVKP